MACVRVRHLRTSIGVERRLIDSREGNEMTRRVIAVMFAALLFGPSDGASGDDASNSALSPGPRVTPELRSVTRELTSARQALRGRDRDVSQVAEELGNLGGLARRTWIAAKGGEGRPEARDLAAAIARVRAGLEDLERSSQGSAARLRVLRQERHRFDQLFSTATEVSTARGAAERERKAKDLLDWLERNQRPPPLQRSRPVSKVPKALREAELQHGNRTALKKTLRDAREAKGSADPGRP